MNYFKALSKAQEDFVGVGDVSAVPVGGYTYTMPGNYGGWTDTEYRHDMYGNYNFLVRYTNGHPAEFDHCIVTYSTAGVCIAS